MLHCEKIGKEVWYRPDPGAVRAALTAVLEYLDDAMSAASRDARPRTRGPRPVSLLRGRSRTMHDAPNQFDLLRERRFAPFFWTQFLGAGNDNVYKNALVIFVAFHAASLTALDANALVNLAGAVFIAPFVLFSATAGQLADKFEKSRLIRWIKLFEIAIMVDRARRASGGATSRCCSPRSR